MSSSQSQRRSALSAHVKRYEGFDASLQLKIYIMMLLQLLLCSVVGSQQPFSIQLLFMFVFSAPLTHALSLAMHDSSHNLVAASTFENRVWGVACNLMQGFPSSETFRRYHPLHHAQLGEEPMDTDLPTQLETQLFRGVIGKAAFVALQPLLYSVRPLLIKPMPLRLGEVINIIAVVAFDVAIAMSFGRGALFYNLMSTLFGMSIHPVASHFITEHYPILTDAADTFSCYSPLLNALTLNVGYHAEHHDFPRVPCSRLPRVYAIGKPLYDALPHHNSGWSALLCFVFDSRVRLSDRIKKKH